MIEWYVFLYNLNSMQLVLARIEAHRGTLYNIEFSPNISPYLISLTKPSAPGDPLMHSNSPLSTTNISTPDSPSLII